MSDTGGGHRASAQAIKAGFQQLYGDEFQFDIVDMWTQHTYFPFNRAAGSYSFMVRRHSACDLLSAASIAGTCKDAGTWPRGSCYGAVRLGFGVER